MTIKKTILFCMVAFLPLCAMAAGEETIPAEIKALNDSVKAMYAPDKRVAVFDINYATDWKGVVLTGATTSADARNLLVNGLKAKGYEVTDNISLLPAEDLGEQTWGIVNMSVCNLRAAADYDAGQSSQALLGMPVKILQKSGWLQVQTPDDYISWVLPSALTRVTAEQVHLWNRAPQVNVTCIYGFVYSEPNVNSQTVSDVVAGDRLKMIGDKDNFYLVEYPDGRRGYLPEACGQPLSKWRRKVKQNAEGIIDTGKKLMGVPYMWGGTSTKGMDCSGFVRTTLLQHDIIIPRDASQMAYKGEHLVIEADFANLKAGDLLFFGRKATEGEKGHVSHVGIYIGNKKFIHSLGWVHISSFDPKDEEYDAYDLNRLLWAQRVLPHVNSETGMTTTDKNEYYK